MTKERKIKAFIFIILTGFILSVIYHYVLGAYLGKPYPSNSFLFTPADRLMDFVNCYNAKSSVYFPFANIIINIFCVITPLIKSLIIFLLLSVIPIVFYFWKNLQVPSKLDSITNTIVFSFFTFPVLFLIDRANFESFVFIFLCFSIYFYQRGNMVFSLILLSFAIAMKLFPAVFLVLYFSDRKYKQIFWTIVSVIILTVFSSFILYGGIIEYLKQLLNSSNSYTMKYVIWDDGMDFGHSLFGLFKYIIYSNNLDIAIPSIIRPYNLLVLVLAVLISCYVIFIEKEFWKKVALLVFTFNLLPYVSCDYKLSYLYIPIFLFINAKHSTNPSTNHSKQKPFKNGVFWDYCYLLLFGSLLIPKNYRIIANIYDGVYLDPIAMILLAFLIILSGFSFSKDNFMDKGIAKKVKK